MANKKKSKQPGQQPWSAEKQRAFNKMALLSGAIAEARTQEEIPMSAEEELMMQRVKNWRKK